jgi:hypothetical protein
MALGYSDTPLAKKLGFKPGYSVLLINEPVHYLDLFADLPEQINWHPEGSIDIIHLFTLSSKEYIAMLPELRDRINKSGMIWVSWPKKSSKLNSDMDENIVRDTALALGLVDIKVCSVDEVWSGLKLVWRKENR